jgi:hypothetical protein
LNKSFRDPIQLEKIFQDELDGHIERAYNNDVSETYLLSYINRTVAAAKTLGIESLQNWEVPSTRHHNIPDEYHEFRGAIEHYLVQIKIAHGRRVRGYSVKLDTATKAKIRHYIDKIREIVARLEAPLPKKEALYSENYSAGRRSRERQNSFRRLCRARARNGDDGRAGG